MDGCRDWRQRLALWSITTLLPMMVASAPVDPEWEILQRVHAFIELYSAPLQSANLVVEKTEIRQRSSTRASLIADHVVESFVTAEAVVDPAIVRDRFQRTADHFFRSRFLLATDFGARYRHEVIEDVIDLTPDNATGIISLHYMTVQGPDGHYSVRHNDRTAEHRHGQLPPHSFNMSIPPSGGWGVLDIFLNAPDLVYLMGLVRGASLHGEADGLTWAQLETGPGTPELLLIGFSPGGGLQEDPIRAILAYSSGHASLYRLLGWNRHDPSRPTEIHIDRIPNVTAADVLDLDTLEELPRVLSQSFRALELELNEPLDDRLFTYSPPEDYVFTEEQSDGSWVIRQHPNPAVMEPQVSVPSARQLRIQDRISVAWASHRWIYVLGAGGFLVLLLAFLIKLRSRGTGC